MTEVRFINPSITICEWLPFGPNNMMSLNRHLGSHKKYKSPTEFGMEGEADINNGMFKMEGSGCFLDPVEYSFSDFLKAELRNTFKDKNAKGLEIDKDGSCFIGLKINNELSLERTKELIGKTEIEFTRQFIPLLADNQISLIETAYGVDDIMKSPYALSSYSLVVAEGLGVPINNTKDFLAQEEYENVLMPVTDWITNHFSIDGCHIFIGMKAMVCIGEYSGKIKDLLKGILFQRTILNVSMRMHSKLWAISKRLSQISKEIPAAAYKELKEFNIELGEISNDFSRQHILSDMMMNSLGNGKERWDRLIEGHEAFQLLETGEGFKEEIEKAEDRELVIKQMYIDMESLRDLLQQRTNLIMTKSGQELNLTLLVLTLISVLGIADVFGFTLQKTILVVVVVVPFMYFAIKSFLHYQKHFK
ncbi:MAG: hypothetical protein K8R63_07965 [Bacteroidales bacterium]|nr:hypothetical protein [Bacteroidales bacterium]